MNRFAWMAMGVLCWSVPAVADDYVPAIRPIEPPAVVPVPEPEALPVPAPTAPSEAPLVGTPTVLSVDWTAPPPPPETRIDINIPARRLILSQGGQKIYEFPVAVGAPSFKTPVGAREMSEIVWNPWWMPPPSPWAKDEKPAPPGPKNPLGPVKMNLGNAILLHGTNNEKSVGRAASHGCMRMLNEDAKTLAWWIQERFTDKTDPALKDTYGTNRGRSYHVKLNSTIPVSITYDVILVGNGKMTLHPDVYWRVGDKKKKILAALQEQGGLMPETVDLAVLDRILTAAKKETMEISLNELRMAAPVVPGGPAPGEFPPSWKPLPRPNEQGAAVEGGVSVL